MISCKSKHEVNYQTVWLHEFIQTRDDSVEGDAEMYTVDKIYQNANFR